MRRAREIIGLPVIDIEAGKQLGTVKDLLIDRDWSLRGVLLETKRWFSSLRYIVWENVVSVGKDAVTVPNEQCVRQLDETNDWLSLLNGSYKLKGLPVITVDGQQLGWVEDVYLEEQLGKKVLGCELSDGLLSDLREGRRWLPSPDNVTLGEDAVIVPAGSDVRQVATPYHEIG